MTQLTENDILPIPDFTAGEVTATEVRDLAKAVYALQRVVVFQHNEITRLKEEATKGGAKRATSTSSKKKTADE